MMPSSPADRLAFIEDMEDMYLFDRDLSIFQQECAYFGIDWCCLLTWLYQVVKLTHSHANNETDWMVF